MRVFVAGATGAIGRPLLDRLAGHHVTATTRSPDRADALRARGIDAVVLDAFDAAAVERAVIAARPDVVVHQLTALPHDASPSSMKRAIRETGRLRRETVPTFLDAAREARARRFLVQSMCFVTRPEGPEVLDEDAPPWLDAPGDMGEAVRPVDEMERAARAAEGIESLVLRYGFFYGPGTWYSAEGTIGRMVRRRMMPFIGDGMGRQSFVHVDDAAAATVLALDHGAPGIYNVTDDDPQTQNEWLEAVASHLGAKRPFRVPAFAARLIAGPAAVHYATTLRGARSGRAKEAFGWQPRPIAEGLREEFAGG